MRDWRPKRGVFLPTSRSLSLRLSLRTREKSWRQTDAPRRLSRDRQGATAVVVLFGNRSLPDGRGSEDDSGQRCPWGPIINRPQPSQPPHKRLLLQIEVAYEQRIDAGRIKAADGIARCAYQGIAEQIEARVVEHRYARGFTCRH